MGNFILRSVVVWSLLTSTGGALGRAEAGSDRFNGWQIRWGGRHAELLNNSGRKNVKDAPRIAFLLPPEISLQGGGILRAEFLPSLPSIHQNPKPESLHAVSISKGARSFEATWHITPLADDPGTFTVSVDIKNTGVTSLEIESIRVIGLSTDARWFGAKSASSFWSFQGGTYPERPDWIFPLRAGYHRDNFQGMNAPDYGGGMPIVDLWTKEGGIALASLAPRPEQISLPVSVIKDSVVEVSIVDREGRSLLPGGMTSTIPFVIILHRGDFFNPLRTYSTVMENHGFYRAAIPAAAYGAEWCAWGYERTCVPQQILETLPLVRELGLDWATIDDGYQNADGDWLLDRQKFPRGDLDMLALVDSIHAKGLKARLWWVPFEAHDSAFSAMHYPGRMKEFGMSFQSVLAKQHPEWFQLNADGSRTQVSYWNSYTLCPAVPEVREYYKSLVVRFLKEWGFDGFKIDGQNMNAVPPCFNPAHHHRSPLDAPRAVPEFFREVYAAAKAIRPDVVFTVCACGTNFSLYNLPFVTNPVASDPLSSWQVRHRAKTYKALLGGHVPYSGDHVELTNRRWDDSLQKEIRYGDEDFASTVGVGGVIATKFTAEGLTQPDSSLVLDSAKKGIWKRWVDIYNRERLSEGEYLNLYDIAYDKPETHVIARGDTLYYALYAGGGFTGAATLRGLSPRRYTLTDFVNGRSFGFIEGPECTLNVEFTNSLLMKAIPN